MKTKLTPEQSQRLIVLGVDANKASATIVTNDYNEDTDNFQHPIFVLTDLLELLPEEINITPGGDTLGIIYHCGQWRVGYSNSKVYCDHTQVAPELIDALSELLIWSITNKHIQP